MVKRYINIIYFFIFIFTAFYTYQKSNPDSPSMAEEFKSIEQALARAQNLINKSIEKSKKAQSFTSRWTIIQSKLEQIPDCISDLSTHPFFSKNTLCLEQLQTLSSTLSETIELSEQCTSNPSLGKLQMQSNLNNVHAKLDIWIKDCKLLIKTGVLTEPNTTNLHELLARIHIGDTDSKHKAIDGLLNAIKNDDQSNVINSFTRGNINALVKLLTSTSFTIRDKTSMVISFLAESGNCENLLITEGVIAPLIRLMESGSIVGREKAVVTLEKLSSSYSNAKSIVEHKGILPLLELSQTDDSVSKYSAVGALKNLSSTSEVRQSLVDEGIVPVMISLLDSGTVLGLKEYAAECLQNLTSNNENIKREVVCKGGINSILKYIDGPLPQESAVGALRNVISLVSLENMMKLEVLPRLVHVLREGSAGAKQAAASAICKVSICTEMKRLVGEYGILPLLVNLLEKKSSSTKAREIACQAISSLMSFSHNRREIKKDERTVPYLVMLLDPSPENTASKYAVSCLLLLVSSKKCKKGMISYGAIGYLKKLSVMDVQGAKKLLEKLEKSSVRSLFSRK